MAVVQISKIQVRRGKKQTSGIPQLASGEFGWAVDSQELYIGNGSVSEGAPYVGNTKILTENDSLIDFALKYQYKKADSSIQTGSTVSLPIERTMQEKIDEVISVKDFGAKGDGITDDTQSIQRAIDQLFDNPITVANTASRVVLDFPAGLYRISQSLKIKSYANIRGAGKDKTIIRQVESYPVLYLNKSATNQSPDIVVKYISISDITIENTTLLSGIYGNNMQDCTFKDVKLLGGWSMGTNISTSSNGIELYSTSNLTATQNNQFINIEIDSFSRGVYAEDNIFNNVFIGCSFKNSGIGFSLGVASPADASQDVGAVNNKMIGCNFLNIKEQGIKIIRGHSNMSQNNSFISVGNDGGINSDAVYSNIYFSKQLGYPPNISSNDYIERTNTMSSNYNGAYVSDIDGQTVQENKFTKTIPMPANSTVPVTLFRLPNFENNLSYKIHYVHKSSGSNTMRSGTLTLMVQNSNNQINLSDEYDYLGPTSGADDVEFSAELADIDNDGIRETIRVKYTNESTVDNTTNSFLSYWYELIS
jgi:hypothetical protein